MGWVDALRQSWREAWDATAHVERNRVQLMGDTRGSEHGVTERLGIDQHRPVRPPDRWKEITILGGEVRSDGKRLGKFLLECPGCAALVTDSYAKVRHIEVCAAFAIAEDT